MSTRSKHGSKPAVHQDICQGCVQRRTNHPDPTQPRYCKRHQCPAEEAPGRPCSIRKKSAETHCPSHYVAPCKMEGCLAPSFDGSLHCELHSCSYRGCQKDARPGKGFEFCEDHKCSDINCQSGRKRVEVEGKLRLEPFCRRHECQTVGCRSKKYPDKQYCVAHCCNIDGCPEKREGGTIGALCVKHYDEKVGKKKVEEYETQKAADERKKAAKEAKEQANREELRRRILEEAEQERLRKEAEEAKAAKAAREASEARERDRSPKTTYSSGRDSGSSFYEQPRIRREAKVVYVYSDDDEAYGSSSGAGAGRHEEYVTTDRPGRTGVNGNREAYQQHHRVRRQSNDNLHEDYPGDGRNRGGW